MTEPSTPLMRQYAAIKKQHPTALLFFRLGDFYELFFEDAVVAAKELQITLTSRNKEKGQAIPMCGVPYHAAENYLSKLLRKGFKVAICEQMEAPSAATKLVRREVTRVLTPGTAIDSSVGSEENNFLAALARASFPGGGGAVGLAALDLSTGEFRATEFRGPDAERRIVEELQQLRPREVLYPSGLPLFDQPPMNSAEAQAERKEDPETRSQTNSSGPGAALQQTGGAMRFTETPLEDWVFSPDYAVPLLENKLGVLSLEGFGLQGRPAAATAARWSMWTASGFTIARNIWCSMPSPCATWNWWSRSLPTPAARSRFFARLTPRSRPWASACCAHGCCARRFKSTKLTGGWTPLKPV
jgi:DNA mismatch repair protein MutS